MVILRNNIFKNNVRGIGNAAETGLGVAGTLNPGVLFSLFFFLGGGGGG